MSQAVEIIKAAGPYVLGVAGIYATYRSGSRQGREARHHTRVEKLYVEMLRSLDTHLRRIIGIDEAPDVPRPNMMTLQVRLYAPRNIQTLWHEALTRTRKAEDLWRLEKHEGAPPDNDKLERAFQEVGARLVQAMSIDLGVPTHRVRTFRAIYQRIRRTRGNQPPRITN